MTDERYWEAHRKLGRRLPSPQGRSLHSGRTCFCDLLRSFMQRIQDVLQVLTRNEMPAPVFWNNEAPASRPDFKIATEIEHAWTQCLFLLVLSFVTKMCAVYTNLLYKSSSSPPQPQKRFGKPLIWMKCQLQNPSTPPNSSLYLNLKPKVGKVCPNRNCPSALYAATRSISTPPGWDTGPSQVNSQQFVRFSPKQLAGSHLYNWVKRGTFCSHSIVWSNGHQKNCCQWFMLQPTCIHFCTAHSSSIITFIL